MNFDIAFFTSLEMGKCDEDLAFRLLFCGATFILYHASHPNKMACSARLPRPGHPATSNMAGIYSSACEFPFNSALCRTSPAFQTCGRPGKAVGRAKGAIEVDGQVVFPSQISHLA